MHHPRRLLTLLCTFLLSLIASTSFAAPPKPNILVVIADQWRAQAFGNTGDPNAKTPNFDKLAAQSVHFTQAVSSIPVCSPFRATFLTGQRALTHGVFLNDVPLNPDAVTVGKVLKQAGYDTGFIGKWHIDGHGRSNFIPRERRQGFDYWKVLECTHNYNNSFYYADGPEKLTWEGYDAIAQTDDAVKYIKSRQQQAEDRKPFVLFLAWGPPHDPYLTAPQKYRDMIDPAKLTLRPNVPQNIEQAVRKNAAGYYAHGAALDDCMGRLREALREGKIDQDTLIVFTADHGDLLGSHGAYHKQQPFDESVRVPMLFHWPAGLGKEGKQLPAPIASPDLMPTILSLAGVPVPPSVQGLSFAEHMKGGKDPTDGAAMILCPAPFGQWNKLLGGREYRGVRTARYTYARDLNGPWILFDNEKDPYQMENLAGKPEASAVQAELNALLLKKLKEAGDEFKPAADYITKWAYKVDARGTVPYEK
jgi:arylsulfatase A-like enzyme